MYSKLVSNEVVNLIVINRKIKPEENFSTVVFLAFDPKIKVDKGIY